MTPVPQHVSAGNQLGKILVGGNEAAMHATGRDPTWLRGFDRVVGWVCGVTGEVVRDSAACPGRFLKLKLAMRAKIERR